MAIYTHNENNPIADKTVDDFLTTESPAVYSEVGKEPVRVIDIEGEPWVVEAYYNQILTNNGNPMSVDVSKNLTLQTYRKIINYQLSLTSKPSYSVGPYSEDMLEGEANFPPHTIVPHIGDMFIATYSGRRMLWTLIGENVSSASAYTSRVYSSAFQFFSTDEAFFRNLEDKTVETLVFDEEALELGQASLITPKEVNVRIGYGALLRKVLSSLYENFYEEALGTFIVSLEDGGTRSYDPFAVDFFNRGFNRKNLNGYRFPSEYGTTRISEFSIKPTFWRAVMERDITWLEHAPRYFGANPTALTIFSGNQWSLRRAGISKVYAPSIWKKEETIEDLEPYLGSNALWDGSTDDLSEDDVLYKKLFDGQQWTPEELNSFYTEARTEATAQNLRKLILLAILLNDFTHLG